MLAKFSDPAYVLYGVSLAAAALSCCTGILEAGRKNYDLFGILIIGFVTALGGGTVRDIVLDRTVAWVIDPNYLYVTMATGLITFIAARMIYIAPTVFLVPDAAALALYTISGTMAALQVGAHPAAATLMGVTTGVVGGIIRDLLCNTSPVVFRGNLYATVAWIGALLFIVLRHYIGWGAEYASACAATLIFVTRVAAMTMNISLPIFKPKTI